MTIYELRDLIDQTGDIDNIPLRCATYSGSARRRRPRRPPSTT